MTPESGKFSIWRKTPTASPRQTFLGYLGSSDLLYLFFCPVLLLWCVALSNALGREGLKLAVFGIGLFFMLRKRLGKAPWTLDRMADLPASVPQYPVTVTYALRPKKSMFGNRWGTPLGTDQGLISFVGRTLYFEGQKTSFSADGIGADPRTARQEAEKRVRFASATEQNPSPHAYTLNWVNGSYRGTIRVRPYERSYHQGEGLRRLLYRDYLGWLSSQGTAYNSQFPPIGPDPDLLSQAKVEAMVWNIVLGLTVIGSAGAFLSGAIGEVRGQTGYAVAATCGYTLFVSAYLQLRLRLIERAAQGEKQFRELPRQPIQRIMRVQEKEAQEVHVHE